MVFSISKYLAIKRILFGDLLDCPLRHYQPSLCVLGPNCTIRWGERGTVSILSDPTSLRYQQNKNCLYVCSVWYGWTVIVSSIFCLSCRSFFRLSLYETGRHDCISLDGVIKPQIEPNKPALHPHLPCCHYNMPLVNPACVQQL